MGLLINTKIKADTKLTGLMWCQIFDRKSVAPSSSNFCQQLLHRKACEQDQEILKNYYCNCLLNSLGTGWRTLAQGSLREFSLSWPHVVEAGEADWIYFIKYCSDLFLFCQYL